MDWQPIETAPKDGTEFLAFYPPGDYEDEDGTFDISWWDNTSTRERGFLMIGGVEPSHWMPLPPPPTH